MTGAIADGLGANRKRERQGIMRAALRLAHSDVDDEAACEKLREIVRARPRGVRGALRSLNVDRKEFDTDRAYRLLQGAASNSSVEPMARGLADLFTREEKLGRMPLSEALDFLCELQPALPKAGSDAFAASILSTLLGSRAVHEDALVRSQLALSIATQYVAIVGGRQDLGGLTTSYFMAPKKVVVSVASDF